jgi:hypothetical protein
MAAEFDIEPHIRTWDGFCKLMLVCVIAAAIVLGLMAIFLT